MLDVCEKQESNVTREDHGKGRDYELREISKARSWRPEDHSGGLWMLFGVL